MSKTAFALVGPTASGKTSLALELSRRFPVEIISVDSLQLFRHLDIGSAKPTVQERNSTPHHMIDILDPDQSMTAAAYSQEARKIIDQILARNKIPLFVGGAGFYLKAVAFPPLEVEASLDAETADITVEEALRLIEDKDPTLFDKIHRHDTYRILRAGQLLRQGHIPTQLWEKTKRRDPAVTIHMLCPDHERSVLHRRIHQRTVEMVDSGLVEETKRVIERFPGSKNKLSKAIGYRESLLFLAGQVSRQEMIDQIQIATRQYAKRQLTWFRGQTDASFVPFDRAVGKLSELFERALPS